MIHLSVCRVDVIIILIGIKLSLYNGNVYHSDNDTYKWGVLGGGGGEEEKVGW